MQLVQGSGRASKQERVAEAYQKTLQYLKANKIVDTDFYLVKDSQTGEEILYIGKVRLSNIPDEEVEYVLDGGDSDVVLATLDVTILE